MITFAHFQKRIADAGLAVSKTVNVHANLGMTPELALYRAIFHPVLMPQVERERVSPYIRWVRKLERGDIVRVCLPWQDKETPGGHIGKGRVVRVLVRHVLVNYQYNGLSHTESFNLLSGASGPFSYILPTTHDVVYDPDYGLRMRKRK